MQTFQTSLVVALVLVLSSCAPPPPGRVTGQSSSGVNVAFYPNQSGAVWQYLKDGERADSPPYALRVEGPQSLNGRILTGMRFLGRGQDIIYFRQFDERGVRLIAQAAPNFYDLVYDEPIIEYPPSKDMVVGKSWSGTTNATFTASKQAPQKLKYTYQFQIVAKEKFRIANTEYDAFLILRDDRVEDLTGKTAPIVESQRIRFVPYIGEVQTREGLVLISYNFKK